MASWLPSAKLSSAQHQQLAAVVAPASGRRAPRQRVLAACCGDGGDGALAGSARSPAARRAGRCRSRQCCTKSNIPSNSRSGRRQVGSERIAACTSGLASCARALLAAAGRPSAAIGRAVAEGVMGLQADQHAERARRDLRVQPAPCRVGVGGPGPAARATASGAGSSWSSAKRHRPADLGRQPPHPGHPRSGPTRSSPADPGGASSKIARPPARQGPADPEQLVLGGERAGHRLAVHGAVCTIVREVEKPSAPASIAARTSSAMAAMSSGVAGSLRAPRSPIT